MAKITRTRKLNKNCSSVWLIFAIRIPRKKLIKPIENNVHFCSIRYSRKTVYVEMKIFRKIKSRFRSYLSTWFYLSKQCVKTRVTWRSDFHTIFQYIAENGATCSSSLRWLKIILIIYANKNWSSDLFFLHVCESEWNDINQKPWR